MNKTTLIAALAALPLATGACTAMDRAPDNAVISQIMMENISGKLAYRERIALPPGAQMEIVVSDITDGADSERILLREQMLIPGRSVPVPFSIAVSKRNLTDGPLYGLRAFIKDSSGTILFGTKSPNVDIGTLMLTMISPGDSGLQDISGIKDSEWRVTQFSTDVAPMPTAPTITFGADGRVYGSSDCNNFSTSYTLNGHAIQLAAIAANLRACEAPLMEQERRFFEVINSLNRVSLDGDGRLVLDGANGRRMVAERIR